MHTKIESCFSEAKSQSYNQMKKILFPILATLLFVGCSSKNFEIVGSTDSPAMNGTKIFIRQRIDRVWSIMDSTVINNEAFKFTGVADTAKIVYLTIEFPEGNKNRQAFILENGKIAVKVDTTGFMTFSGTPLNDSLQTYQNVKRNFYKMADKVFKQTEDTTLNKLQRNEIDKKLDELSKEEVSIDKKFCVSNINTLTGIFIFTNSFYQMTTDEKESIIQLMNAETKENKRIKEIIADVETEKKVAVGQKFTNFKLPSIQGDSISLSSLVGKTDYVMIDFWASWCGPCMHSLPELKKIYDNYKGKRFQILGVSLDQDQNSWKQTVAAKNLTWQHVSDLKGWKSAAARAYAINAIPATVLINKEGIIVAKNLKPGELEKYLSENTQPSSKKK